MAHVTGNTLEVFGLWIYAHTTATDWDRAAFEEAACVTVGRCGILEDCWKLAVTLQSLDFRNWLLNPPNPPDSYEWEEMIRDIESSVDEGLAGTVLVTCQIDYLAYLLVENHVGLAEALYEWSISSVLPDAGPMLLSQLLFAIEDMQQLKAMDKLVDPNDQACARYHNHRSLEERRACREHRKEEKREEGKEVKTAGSLSDAGGEGQVTFTPNDVDLSDGEYDW